MRLRPLLFSLASMLALTASAAARAACPPTPATAPLAVNFLGVSTIVLRAGNEAIMVDGFFSRPSLLNMLSIRPNRGRILPGLEMAGISHREGPTPTEGARLLALLVAQAHHDHSMDAGFVARATGATLVGSPSTAQVALGAVSDLAGIDRVEGGEQRCFGPFGVKIIASPHARGPIPWLLRGELSSRVRPGSWVFAFRDRLNFSFLVSYDKHRILIHPSAAFPRDGLVDIHADIVFLSVGDLAAPYAVNLETYWREVVRRSCAGVVVPIHWDDFFRPVDLSAPASERLRVARLGGPGGAVNRLRDFARRDGVVIRELNAFEEHSLEGLLAANEGFTRQCRENRPRARGDRR